MTCPDDPAAARRMLSPPNHLEPAVGVTESEVGRLKRKIARQAKEIAAWRMNFPDYTYHEKNDAFSYNGVMMYEE